VPIFVGLSCAYSLKEFGPLRPMLEPLFALAFAWSVAGIYFLSRGKWSDAMPENAGLSTGLEFCRGELERQRDVVRRALVWTFGPLILALGAFILALGIVISRDPRLMPNGIPFLLLLVVWIFGYFSIRLREQRQLEREMDELNDLAAQK